MAGMGREADASSTLDLHCPTAHLGKLLLGRLSTRIKVVRQILQMDALGAFLTCFYSHGWQGNVARTALAQEFRERQVRKEVATNCIEWNDGLALYCAISRKAVLNDMAIAL